MRREEGLMLSHQKNSLGLVGLRGCRWYWGALLGKPVEPCLLLGRGRAFPGLEE